MEFEIFVQTSAMAIRGLSHLLATYDPSLYAIIEVSLVQLNGFGHRYAGDFEIYRLDLDPQPSGISHVKTSVNISFLEHDNQFSLPVARDWLLLVVSLFLSREAHLTGN